MRAGLTPPHSTCKLLILNARAATGGGGGGGRRRSIYGKGDSRRALLYSGRPVGQTDTRRRRQHLFSLPPQQPAIYHTIMILAAAAVDKLSSAACS